MSVALVEIFKVLLRDPENVRRVCEKVGEMPNIEFITMGGEVFWDTLASRNGYRLQRNVFTRHCRILDPCDYRIAWGSEEALLRRLKRIA